MPKIQHSRPAIVPGAGRLPHCNMAAMRSPRPERSTPEMRRLAQVKFVALQLEPDAPAAAPAPAPGFFASLRSSLFRVIGCPEAARP